VKYLVDSDYVADYLNGQLRSVAIVDSLREDGLGISVITFGEVHEGILYSRQRDADETNFNDFLRSVSVLPVTRRIMRFFAEVRGQLRVQGQLIGDMDLLIASTALANDLTLVTRNARHFERIPGLDLYQRS
jgi:predicted nucleic acid-binding protein